MSPRQETLVCSDYGVLMDMTERLNWTGCHHGGFPGGSVIKNPPLVQEPQEMCVQSPDWEDPLEEGMATHSSILAWRILWTEEPGAL